MLTTSKTQTQKLAAELAKKIIKAQSSKIKAYVLALQGDLGAGKTTFTQGFIKALGVKQHITSPTFVIFRKYTISEKRNPSTGSGHKLKSKKELKISKTYNLKTKTYQNVYHFDLYRIHSAKELSSLHFKKILNDPQNIVLIEWPERIGKAIPRSADWIYFEHGKNIRERRIVIGK